MCQHVSAWTRHVLGGSSLGLRPSGRAVLGARHGTARPIFWDVPCPCQARGSGTAHLPPLAISLSIIAKVKTNLFE